MDESKLKAIIIGASSGIGRALALELSKQGYILGLAARRENLLRDIQKELAGPSYLSVLDLRKPDDSIRHVETLIQEMGGLDLMVVNSGMDVPDADLNWTHHCEILQVNVIGFIAMCYTALKYFQEKNAGHLVGISSIASIRGNGRSPGYSASKAYVTNYLEGVRQRFQSPSIHITNILPGFVDTAMLKERKYVFWVARPEEVARQIYQAIRAKKTKAYVTRRWVLIAWIYRFLPAWFYDFLYRKRLGIKKN